MPCGINLGGGFNFELAGLRLVSLLWEVHCDLKQRLYRWKTCSCLMLPVASCSIPSTSRSFLPMLLNKTQLQDWVQIQSSLPWDGNQSPGLMRRPIKTSYGILGCTSYRFTLLLLAHVEFSTGVTHVMGSAKECHGATLVNHLKDIWFKSDRLLR